MVNTAERTELLKDWVAPDLLVLDDLFLARRIDSNHCELQVVDGFSVEVAYSGDDFTNNLVTILGEMRVIPVFRTVGSMRLITPLA